MYTSEEKQVLIDVDKSRKEVKDNAIRVTRLKDEIVKLTGKRDQLLAEHQTTLKNITEASEELNKIILNKNAQVDEIKGLRAEASTLLQQALERIKAADKEHQIIADRYRAVEREEETVKLAKQERITNQWETKELEDKKKVFAQNAEEQAAREKKLVDKAVALDQRDKFLEDRETSIKAKDADVIRQINGLNEMRDKIRVEHEHVLSLDRSLRARQAEYENNMETYEERRQAMIQKESQLTRGRINVTNQIKANNEREQKLDVKEESLKRVINKLKADNQFATEISEINAL